MINSSPITRAICLAALLAAAPAARAMSIFDVDAGGPVPASGTRGESRFTFTVEGLQAPVTDLNVRLSVRHSWDSDLIFDLTSPSGTTARLAEGVGLWLNDFQDTLLDDDACLSIDWGWAPFAGPEHGGRSYRPHQALRVFHGENPTGLWTLTVTDRWLGDSGQLLRAGDSAPWGTAIGTQLIFEQNLSTPAPVPEPMTLIGLGAGLSAGAGYLHRRRRA